MRKQTQKSQVERILKSQGYIDNYYCIETRLTLRLSAIIERLRKEGWDIGGSFLEGKKNWRYTLDSQPTRTVIKVVERGGLYYKEQVQVPR